ncbi:unnamed protein product, partial [Didymodactylos carnosus]
RLLFEAAYYNKLKTLERSVKYLLSKGANPNLADEYTNVNDMAKKYFFELIDNGRRISRDDEFSDRLPTSTISTFKGFTCLHYAVLLDNLSIIQILIEYNADPLLANEEGHLPSVYVGSSSNKCKDLILEYEKKAQKLSVERMKSDRRKFPLEVRIKENIIGQNDAISTVCGALRRKESGWTNNESPLVFLFLGSSGVGKTELAKQIARYINTNDANNKEKNKINEQQQKKKDSFIRIDMSEYQDKHEVSKLIGSPPGYVGYGDGGQLTESLAKCPTAVVLFDEIDKAHPEILTIMLQLFDEGRLTDGQGKTVDGKQAIYVLTSNLASDEIAEYAQKVRKAEEIKQRSTGVTAESSNAVNTDSDQQRLIISKQFKDDIVKPILKKHFRRNEFLGRINEMVYFLPFSKSEINQLLIKELEYWKQRANDQHSIDIIWDLKALNYLAKAYDLNYGARSIKHEIERSVVNQLASAFEQSLIVSGNQILLTTSTHQQSNIKLQKVELIPIEHRTDSSSGALKYIDIKLDDHLKREKIAIAVSQ